jgi:hypothetical protein
MTQSLITKLFEKRGIKDVSELSMEEKSTFDNYQKILSKDKLEVEDLVKFINNQISVIENKWRDMNIDESKKAQLLPYHTVYKAILSAIESPKAEKEALESFLRQQIESN